MESIAELQVHLCATSLVLEARPHHRDRAEWNETRTRVIRKPFAAKTETSCPDCPRPSGLRSLRQHQQPPRCREVCGRAGQSPGAPTRLEIRKGDTDIYYAKAHLISRHARDPRRRFVPRHEGTIVHRRQGPKAASRQKPPFGPRGETSRGLAASAEDVNFVANLSSVGDPGVIEHAASGSGGRFESWSSCKCVASRAPRTLRGRIFLDNMVRFAPGPR
jgi:hypothetical protein